MTFFQGKPFFIPPGYSSQKSPRKNSSLQNFKLAETGERFIQFFGFPWLRRRFVRVLSAALLCGPWRRFMLLACICSACRRFVALWGLWCVVSWRAVYSSMNTAPGLLLRISFLYSSKNAAGASSSACFALALYTETINACGSVFRYNKKVCFFHGFGFLSGSASPCVGWRCRGSWVYAAL